MESETKMQIFNLTESDSSTNSNKYYLIMYKCNDSVVSVVYANNTDVNTLEIENILQIYKYCYEGIRPTNRGLGESRNASYNKDLQYKAFSSALRDLLKPLSKPQNSQKKPKFQTILEKAKPLDKYTIPNNDNRLYSVKCDLNNKTYVTYIFYSGKKWVSCTIEQFQWSVENESDIVTTEL